MDIEIKNITFEYKHLDVNKYLGLTDDIGGIGINMVTIPKNHIKQMIKDGYFSELRDGTKILPHTEDCEENYIRENGKYSDYNECYNSDAIIVYINWMLSKNKSFKLPIFSQHPFWIFHDYLHADNDVYGVEVCCLSKNIENRRLIDAAVMMKEYNIYTEFSKEYIDNIRESFRNRWKESFDKELLKYIIIEEENFDYES